MGKDALTVLIMVLVQFGFAGMNILSKLAFDSGMNPFVLVAYRQLFASMIALPFAYFFERQEKARLKKMDGQAKVMGTLVGVGGAMLLSLYHGPIVPIGKSHIHLSIASKMHNSNDTNHGNPLGPCLVIFSAVSWAIWFVLQAKMCNIYPAPYTSSALMLSMATIQTCLLGLVMEHKLHAWSLSPPIRALSCIYAGVVCSMVAIFMISWCIERKGPLFVSVFNPLLLIIVAVLSWGLLEEKLYLGTILGSLLIVGGLYCVLWGKSKEVESIETLPQEEKQKEINDMEMQMT
ncbi:WAT1-related protein [Tanacetum coccineum]